MEKTKEIPSVKSGSMITVLKGLWVGGTMTVPGVSGGSMAIIAGIYDKLLSSVGGIWKKPKESISFLVKFMIGALVGIFVFANIITMLLETRAEIPLRFFFLGAVAGGIPLIMKEAKVIKFSPKLIVYIVAGFLCVWLIGMIPDGFFAVGTGGIKGIIIQLAGGFLIAVALVLPGISASQMLYMLGIYEKIMASVSAGKIFELIPISLGMLAGTFLTASFLEKLLNKYPTASYMIILGFMLGSIPELFPDISGGANGISIVLNIILCVLSLICGFMLILKLSSLESEKKV
ncbi:MAG: DUF368 domain-containing protein [Hominimerdicola sp.]